MLPLIPLALSFVPQLASWLFGSKAEATTAAITTAAATITGIVDPQAQVAALGADPEKATAFRVELAKLAAQMAADERAAELAMFQAQLADVAGARAQTATLVAGHSPIAWGAPVVSVIVMLTFLAVMTLVLLHAIPEGSGPLANVMLGTLAAMATATAQYWVGSSSSSRAKDDTISEQSRSLATSTPGQV